MTDTIDIYTAGELKKLREKLLREQGITDALTKLPLDFSKSVTDHMHDSNCFVRGVKEWIMYRILKWQDQEV